VPILLSDAFVEALLLEEHITAVRRIDRVRLKGSAQPMSLYTYDCGEAGGYCDPLGGTASSTAGEKPGVGPDGGGCRGMSFAEYRALFGSGVDAYVAGDWRGASALLRRCALAWPSDAPAGVLLAVMDAAGGQAPADWSGVRDLVEK
jgi:hypothetical protein